jgi:membrane dipeptidase
LKRLYFICLFLMFACVPESATIHEESFVVDAHSDALYRLHGRGGDLGTNSRYAHVDIDKLKRGGVDLQFLAAWVPSRYMSKGENDPDSSAYMTDELIDILDEQIIEYGDKIAIALSARDARAIREQGKIALALGIEGGHSIENSLELLEHFYNRGARYMTLTWMNSTDWAVAAREELDVGPERRGLTGFGREVVLKMNELGMIVDVSHVHESTFRDVMEISRDPVIASHSCAAAINPHFRNLTDDQLVSLAENGGVLCLNFYPLFLDSAYRSAYNSAADEYKAEIDSIRSLYRENDWGLYLKLRREIISRKTTGHEVTVDRIVDHIDHVVAVAGIDHIGLGSDFDGIDVTPVGMEDASKFPELTRRLLERGYSTEEVAKIVGGNFMRVFREVTE